MSAIDAQTSRGLSQRIQSATKAIQQGFFNERALLKIAEKKGRIKYGGSHTEVEWYIRNVPTGQTAEFGNPAGELSVLTFEEQQPANRVHLPYCYILKTYGISDRSIEANKNASANKIYDIVAENLTLAQLFMYEALGPALYNETTDDVEQPVGLLGVTGSPIHTGGAAVVAALVKYADKTLSTGGFTGTGFDSTGLGILRTPAQIDLATSWDDAQWAPIVGSVEDILVTGGSTLDTWHAGCLEALATMADLMSLTRTVSGTGTQIKPDIALMAQGPFSAVKNLLMKSQYTYNVPLGRSELVSANFPNIVVDSLAVIKDTDVPNSADGTERVFVCDSSQFSIETTHTKSEGLIKNDFDPNITIINGAVGTLKANLMYRWNSPTAVGCIVGCDD